MRGDNPERKDKNERDGDPERKYKSMRLVTLRGKTRVGGWGP